MTTATSISEFQQAEKLLRLVLAPDDNVLVRPIESYNDGGRKQSRTVFKETRHVKVADFSAERFTALLDVAEQERANLFYGVCPRFGDGGRFDLAWQIRVAHCLWADLDNCSVAEALDRCQEAGLPQPSAVVSSGNGVHLYWALAAPYMIDDVGDPPAVEKEWTDINGKNRPIRYFVDPETEEKVYLNDPSTGKRLAHNSPKLSSKAIYFQDVVAGIAASIGGDHTIDVSRLLRLPGTMNRKDERNGREPVPCQLVECCGERYPLSQFEQFAKASPSAKRRKEVDAVKLPTVKRPSAKRQDWLNELVTICGMANVGDRSEADFSLCCFAIEGGISPEKVWELVEGVGKFGERGRPYFDQTWEKSEARTKENIYAKLEDKVAGTGRGSNGQRQTDVTGDGKPRINADNEDLGIVTGQAWDAINAANDPPTLFRRGSLPSRVEPDDDGAPIIKTLSEARTRYHMARSANWHRMKYSGSGSSEIATAPPPGVVKDVLATPDPPLPVLTRIVEAPVYAPSGELQTDPGYHAASRTYYAPAPGFKIPAVSQTPSDAERQKAVTLVTNELLGDFPFVGDSERAHAISLFLLPFARDLILGPTPFHLIEKPMPGTGATLMVDALLYPAIGRPVPAMTEGGNDEESRKRIFAKLQGGPTVVTLDNIQRRLDSSALASAITAWPEWEDRILGKSETARVPVRCAWVGTGNNPSVSSEMARRIVRIRLDAKVDRPWLRAEFRHDDLRKWVTDNRPQLVWAALTLIQAWLAAGRPEGQKSIGMFESWAKVIGGILSHASIPGFLDNIHEFYDESDAEGEAWREFVATWWEKYGNGEVTTGVLMKTAEDILDLGDKSDHSMRVRLGKLLSNARDRVFTVEVVEKGVDRGIEKNVTRTIRIDRRKTGQRARRWKLVETTKSECGEYE